MTTETSTLPPPASSLDAKLVLAVLTALVAICTVFLHLVGVEVHRAYLGYWHLDAGLFPKPVDWLLITGHQGLMLAGLQAVTAMLKHIVLFLLLAIPLGLYVWWKMSPNTHARLGTPGWPWLPKPWRRPVSYVGGALLFLAILPVGLYGVITFTAIPVLIGHRIGISMAQREAADFRKGCDASKAACVVLRRDGKEVGTGYVLDSSPSHIALFDVGLQRSRALSRDGIDMIGVRPVP